jgi:nucleotide-binding universal stress UspA family protein
MDPTSDPTRNDPAPVTGGEPGTVRVVVGVDGSAGSRLALEYAWTVAAERGAALQVVATFPVQVIGMGSYVLAVPTMDLLREETASRVHALLDEVRAAPGTADVPGAAEVPTTVSVSAGPAAQALVDASAGADLLVVGSRGRGAVRSAVLGSVALHCVTHAACPVVVVHPGEPRRWRTGPVVVGVDGSDASRAALVAGLAEAARRDVPVAVVAAYQAADYWPEMSSVVLPTGDEVRADLERVVEDMVEGVVADHRERSGGRAPTVRTVVTEGAPADVLRRWTADAGLLVVGNRGRGSLHGLLLGSVALSCAMHGPGPVLVVRPAAGPGRPGAAQSGPAPARA